MRTFTALIAFGFLGMALALPHPDNMEKEKEFEKEFNVLHNNKEQEKKAADQLAKEEKEIEEQNSNPNGHFKEKLNQWSDLDKETFLREKTGLKTEARMIYPTGLLWDPNTRNTPAEKAMLEANYRKLKARGDLPDSYSAKDDGKYSKSIFSLRNYNLKIFLHIYRSYPYTFR